MINFIFNTDKYDKIGIKYRYQDFNSFLKDYKIEYSISNACQKHCFNIVDLFYMKIIDLNLITHVIYFVVVQKRYLKQFRVM